jgi:long-chain fatty acid transport protein
LKRPTSQSRAEGLCPGRVASVRRWHLALAGLAVWIAPSVALATQAELFGAGPRSTALAGAGTSLGLDAESALMNPAKLAPAVKELSFGLRASNFNLELEWDGSEEPYPADNATGFFLGATTPLSDGDVEAAFGLFAGSPPDYIVRARLPFAEEPDFPTLVRRASAFDFAAGLGLRYDFFSLGIGIRALAALTGTVGAEDRNGTPVQVVSNELVPAWAPVFGLGFEPGADFSVGMSLRTVLRADFDVTLATDDLGGVPLPPMHVRGVAHFEPLRLDTEVSRRFDRTTLLVALGYERWSDYPGTLGSTLECPDDVPACGTSAPAAPNASDVFVPRVAVSHDVSFSTLGATLRAGYSFVPAALPEQRGAANALDSARHGLAVGYSVGFGRAYLPLHLDGAFRFDLLAPRTHEKTSGTELTTRGNVVSFVFGARIDL